MILLPTQITTALADRLALARVANGYITDVGATVYQGQLRGGAIQAPCIYLLPGRTAPGKPLMKGVKEKQRAYEIRGFVDSNDHKALSDVALVDLIAWDIERAVELITDRLGGLIDSIRWTGEQPGFREEGGTLVGAGVTYDIVYRTTLADPSAAV